MSGYRFLFYLCVLVFFFLMGCKKKNNEEPPHLPGYLAGTVTNQDGKTVVGSHVSVSGREYRETISNQAGQYLFKSLPWGNYTLMVTMDGYISYIEDLDISSQDTVWINAVLEAGSPFIRLSDSMYHLPYLAGETTIRIESNTSWTVSCAADWITLEEPIGEGNDTLSFAWTENPDFTIRSSIITFSDGTHDHHVIVQQGFKIQVTNIYFAIGNDITSVSDSITLIFNQPVEVIQLENVESTCIPVFHPRYVDDSTQIRFDFGCGRLGGEFKIRYTLKDRFNYPYIDISTVKFFTDKITVPGKISACYITEDNSSCWVTLQFPGRLIEVSLDNHTIIRTISLPYNPASITMNPWDQKLYLTASVPNSNKYDSTVYVIDPASGNPDRAFSFHRDQYDHPQFPAIFPYALQFTGSGYGAALLMANGSTSRRWKVIDCATNDSISIHPDWFTVSEYHDFKDLYTSYDNENIFMTDGQYGCDLAALNGQTHMIDLLVPPVVSYGKFIRPNKLNGNLWLSQAYEQYLLYPDNTYSSLSHIYLENFPCGDFTYRNDQQEMLYVCADYLFHLVDYQTGATVFKTELQYNLQNLMSTTDGEQFLMHRSSDANSSLLFFSSTLIQP